LLEKKELMDAIWPDQFVEESNLAFNIRVLRRTLGDDAAQPKFIETVPRRGYRFIAEVVRDDIGHQRAGGRPGSAFVEAIEKTAVLPTSKRRPFLIALLVIAGLLFAAFVIASKMFTTPDSEDRVLSWFPNGFKQTRISNSGNVRFAVISKDGKYIVYLELEEGGGTVWLRDVATGTNTQLAAPTTDVYAGFAFSPDSRHL
jgi:hypothetical protein